MTLFRPILLLGLLPSMALAAPWLETALARFETKIPPGVGYTVDLTRNGDASSERFDPSAPPDRRWTLLAHNGAPPTAAERDQYRRQRQGVSGGGAGASLEPAQLDRDSARIVAEDATHATVALGFNPGAADADKMLRHLDLTLRVDKVAARVEGFVLRLRAPYSPVLGVKMNELESGADFSADGLPARVFSRFRGRIFFRSVEEDIETRYRDFVRPAG